MDLVEHRIYSKKLFLYENTDFSVDRGYAHLYTKGVEHSKIPTCIFESSGVYCIKSFGVNSFSPNLLLFNAVYLYLCDNKKLIKRESLGSDRFLLISEKEDKTQLTQFLNALIYTFKKTLDYYRRQKSYNTYESYLEAIVNHSGRVVPYLNTYVHNQNSIVNQNTYFYTTVLDIYKYYQLLKAK